MLKEIRGILISRFPVHGKWAAIPLRLIVGLGFIQHGYAKLARGPENFADILHAMGMPFPHLLSLATIAVELGGGLLTLAGMLLPLAAIPMIAVLLVAIVTVHIPNGFSSIKLMSYDAAGAHFGQPGYETDLLYMAGIVALCIVGAGPLSIDRLLSRPVREPAAIKSRQTKAGEMVIPPPLHGIHAADEIEMRDANKLRVSKT